MEHRNTMEYSLAAATDPPPKISHMVWGSSWASKGTIHARSERFLAHRAAVDWNTAPMEVLDMIFRYLQPHYVPTHQLWENPKMRELLYAKGVGDMMGSVNYWKLGEVPEVEEWRNVDRPTETIHIDWKSLAQSSTLVFHPTIRISESSPSGRKTPTLLVLGGISRHWRRASFMHPFWSSLSWHYLEPMHIASQFSWSPRKTLDSFYLALAAEEIRVAQVRHIYMDFRHLGHKISAPVFAMILARLSREKIESVFIDMPWLAIGDPEVMKFLARFPLVQRIFINGIKSTDVFYGIDSRSIKAFRESLQSGCLTHLYLDGFGVHSSFTTRSLIKLLKSQHFITTLTLGFVRGGIDLNELSYVLPNLSSFTLIFSTLFLQEANFEWLAEGEDMPDFLDPQEELLPRLTGNLGVFLELCEVGLKCKNGAVLFLNQITDILGWIAMPSLITHLYMPRKIRGNAMDLVKYSTGRFKNLEMLVFGDKPWALPSRDK